MAETFGNLLDTQKGNDSNTSMVAVAVDVGCVDVDVTVTVTVGDGDTVTVALGVDVNGSGVDVVVEEATGSGVGRGGSSSGRKKYASRRAITSTAGMAYRVQTGIVAFRKGVTTGGSPVYPNEPSRLAKLSWYSPETKFT